MSEINYFQLEQGIRILELEDALSAARADAGSLKEELDSTKSLHEKDAAILKKTIQDLARLKSDINKLEKEKNLLHSLNPEKLKRSLHEQKRKTEEAKAALIELKNRTKEAHHKNQKEIQNLKATLYKLLTEEDFFAEIGCYRLMVSGFRFPDDTKSDKALTRIRVLNTITSESCVVKKVTTDGKVEIPTGMLLPPEVKQRVIQEWTALNYDKANPT
ncbi:hypothetical protein [Marinobacterium sp. LSUCC0821]|uniref:hypothetical protein n=1 Tax=Marinobacterium sp. LSUCC0821 TaxID=2668067 RepID=UPI0014511784|nr:hypothetical protein [Marinobacterium sp. LSUCC0821]QJD72066.1 hypothetical protein HH196_10315 [Marinobacterium sp. LSUCC0821]